MNHQGGVILHTKRLTLRPLRHSEAIDMINNWTSSSEVTKHTTWLANQEIETTHPQMYNDILTFIVN